MLRKLAVLLLVLRCGGASRADSSSGLAPGDDGANVIRPELVRRADVIVQAALETVTPQEGGVLLHFLAPTESLLLKGIESRAERDIFVPDERGLKFTVHPEDYTQDAWIFFATYDLDKRRNILLDDRNAAIPFDSETARQIRHLANAQSGVSVHISATKKAYRVGDPPVIVWRIKNISDKPLHIYTGQYAFRLSYTINDTRAGGGWGSTQRKAEDFKLLPPGQTLEHRETLRDNFPQGSTEIEAAYVCQENAVISEEPTGRRIEDAALARVESSFVLPILAPTNTALQSRLQQLKSPVWETQRQAMLILGATPHTARLPQVRAMAAHPWAEIRKLAAGALTLGDQPFGPQLRALLFDPDKSVRDAAFDFCQQRAREDSELSVLALIAATDEAIPRLTLQKNDWDVGASCILINNNPSPRLGDIWAARLRAGQDNGKLLSYVSGIGPQMLRAKGDGDWDQWKPTPAQKKLILAAWAIKRKSVKNLWTLSDLQRETALCRARVFHNYAFGLHLNQVRALMHKLNTSFDGYGETPDAQQLAALGPGIGPAMLWILQNSFGEYDSGVAYTLLAKWKTPGAANYLIGRCYLNQTIDQFEEHGALYAPLPALKLDRARTYPQLQFLMERSLGAAVALASLGEKRPIPVIMRAMSNPKATFNGSSRPETLLALSTATGQQFKTPDEWLTWWKKAGQSKKRSH